MDSRTRLAAEGIDAGAARVLEAAVLWVNKDQLRVLPAQTGAFSGPTVLSTASWTIAFGIIQHWLDGRSCILGDLRALNSTTCVIGKPTTTF